MHIRRRFTYKQMKIVEVFCYIDRCASGAHGSSLHLNGFEVESLASVSDGVRATTEHAAE